MPSLMFVILNGSIRGPLLILFTSSFRYLKLNEELCINDVGIIILVLVTRNSVLLYFM